jgi:hypothetical protein
MKTSSTSTPYPLVLQIDLIEISSQLEPNKKITLNDENQLKVTFGD